MESDISLPVQGQSKTDVLARMQAWRQDDLDWRDGRVFSLVFHADSEAGDLLKEAYNMFFSENGLNPTAFPSLRRFETEVIAMSASLLGSSGSVVGNMTSGGTESILMAMLTAREWARVNRPEIKVPEVILPISGHPAFEKAAHYFDMKIVHTPVDVNMLADVTAVQEAVNKNTIMLVGSAPSYPHGVVDPITALAHIAQAHALLFHVDACVGGFMLPFVRKAGYPIPAFDFSVPGVTSMSADLHKYGYAAKGASVVLYCDNALRRHQLFAYIDWPGGIYASPTMAGTRPGGAIAAAWAIMNYLGEEGYVEMAKKVMNTAVRLKIAIDNIKGLFVWGNPPASLMSIGSHDVDIYEVGDEMGQRGWQLDRQQFPPSLHLTINHLHTTNADAFIMDLADSVQTARKLNARKLGNRVTLAAARAATKALPDSWVSSLTARASSLFGGDAGLLQRSAAMYGMLGTLPNRGDLREIVLDIVEQFTMPQEEKTDQKRG
ncbi:MAG: aspartate aminotransferase family protein [Anaerolineales bacterium]|nr:aspartate aminotransferase family protein [Anaerolineales bacterium]